MSAPLGRTIPLSLPRRLIGDFLHFAKQVPTIPVQRSLNIARLVEARRVAAAKISWCTLFMKAYALLSTEQPALRRTYVAYPYPRLYEHGQCRAALALEREYDGEPSVFFAYFRAPETQLLTALEKRLRYFQTEPVEKVKIFRRALAISRLPRPLRRIYWWAGLNLMGSKKASRMGTFGLSVYSGLGAESLHPISPLTTTLNYGVIAPNGDVSTRIVYDHRVLDGAVLARALGRLEAILNGAVAAELREMKNRTPRAG